MAVNTFVEVQQLIISRLYGFDQIKLSGGGGLEFLRDYIYAIDNATTDEEKTTALQTLRDAILAVDEADVTLSELRNLVDIFHASDIGDIDSVKINGVTSTTVAQTIGTGVTLVSGDNNLVDAINKIGDISAIKLDGSTAATSLAAVIGTSALVTDFKTDLISAINSVNTMPSNILVSTGSAASRTFYKCSDATTQDADIAIATYASNAIDSVADTKIDILNGWVKCIKYSQETDRWRETTNGGSSCVDITSEGDALAECLGAITSVTSYS
ncbi:MAG: hypothetical protein KBC27_01345 [Rickettsiales bacterium]|nr:hypothetical protein [Rickettsiales bacterium]